MADPADHLEAVAEIARGLEQLGLMPVLVGGMALVVLGSRRVTRDFDLVVAEPAQRLRSLLDLCYDHGLELVSRFNEEGEVTATIANRRVAAVRLRLDAPASAYFLAPRTGLRLDLLFDFPISAAELREKAVRTRIRSHVLHLASEGDLLRLKRIAMEARTAPGDAEDVAFLERRRGSGP